MEDHKDAQLMIVFAKIAIFFATAFYFLNGSFCSAQDDSRVDLTTITPSNLGDLATIQGVLQRVLPVASGTLVELQSDSSHGSGVIVSPDGMIYTAAHVVRQITSDKRCFVILPSGERIMCTLLSLDVEQDIALLQLDQVVKPYPTFALLVSSLPRVGEWVFALGHSGGYDAQRGPGVRLGRVVSIKEGIIQTDCKMIGGDSGGGLFNMKGQLIGIHSTVGAGLEDNAHVPVSIFEKLQKSVKGNPSILK